MDYNLHKSNSTYFADLDVARAHAVGAVIRTGLARLNSGDEDGLPKANIEVLGSKSDREGLYPSSIESIANASGQNTMSVQAPFFWLLRY